jgi:hypothetical protein
MRYTVRRVSPVSFAILAIQGLPAEYGAGEVWRPSQAPADRAQPIMPLTSHS